MSGQDRMRLVRQVSRTSVAMAVGLVASLWLLGCRQERVPYRPTGAELVDSSLIGSTGPVPYSGWQVREHHGVFDQGDYHNTGGTWYLVIADSAFVWCSGAQLYLKRSPEDPNPYSWYLYKQFRVSDRFIYIEDPMKGYGGFEYLIFIYSR